MTKAEKLKEAYGLISGELLHLPNKKWKTYIRYAEDFHFIENKNLLKQISKIKMTLDYSSSLYDLHKPLGPIQEIHFLSMAQHIGCICEAMLRDLLYFKIQKIDDKITAESLREKFKRPQLSDLLSFFKDVLIQNDRTYLGNIKKLRDTIHINIDTDYIKYIEETGHITTEKITDDFLGGVFIKKEMNVNKLISEFDSFCSTFSKYYK